MSTPYLGEIRVVGFNFPPVGFATCNGQLLSINDNSALFALLGTTYGGDGINTFAVPNLNSRLGVGTQNGSPGPGLSTYPLGAQGGTEGVTLNTSQLPVHGHAAAVPIAAVASGAATSAVVGKFPAASASTKPYASASTAGATLNPQALTAAMGTTTGGNQPHSNVQPVLAMNYIIATEGIFPPQ